MISLNPFLKARNLFLFVYLQHLNIQLNKKKLKYLTTSVSSWRAALRRSNFSSCVEGKTRFKKVYIINGINKNHLSNSLQLLQSNYLIQDSPPPAGPPDRDYWTCNISLMKKGSVLVQTGEEAEPLLLLCAHSLSLSLSAAAVHFITPASWEHLYVSHLSLQHFQAAAPFSIIALCLPAGFQP